MNLFQIIYVPLFLIASMEFILGIILLKNNPRNSRVQKAVTALSFFSAAFSCTSAIMYTRASMGLSIDLVARFNWIGWFTVPAALQVLYFLKDEQGRTGHIVGLVLYPIWLVILGLCLFTDLIVAPGYSVSPFINHPGPLEHPARLFGTLLAFWLLYGLIRIRKELQGLKRAQLAYLLTGSSIFCFGASTTAGLLQLIGGIQFEPGLAAFFSFPWVVLTYYAISRYRLFDVRFIVSRALSMAFMLFLFSLAQIGLYRVFAPALGESFSLLISLSALGIIFFGTRLNRRVQGWVQQLVLQNKYDYQEILRKSIQAITSMLDLDELLDYIIESMEKSLRAEKAYFLLKEKGEQFSIKRGHSLRQEAGYLGTQVNTVTPWLLRTRCAVMREEVENTMLDGAGRVAEAMKKMGAGLIVPLLYKGDVKGLIVLGQKGNGDLYLSSDISLLETLAGQAAIAIENARLYEESQQMRQQLQQVLRSLQESEARFRTLAETTSAGIFIHRGGRFLYANPAIKQLTGFDTEEFLSQDFWTTVHPDYRDLVRERGKARLQGAQLPPEYEVKIITKNGEERWGNLTAGVIDYEGEPAVIVTFFDITIRKRMLEERDALYEQRIAVEKRHVWEKEKLLMDLHDGIGGITTNISILSEIGRKAADYAATQKTLATISQLSREGISEIRSFMHSLDSKELNWRTLAAELKIQGTTMMESHGIMFELDSSMEEIEDQPGSLLWVNLFKIYKEALTNIIKHAKADRVMITLRISRSGLQLAIQDNGRGWKKTNNAGRGVSNMRRRAVEVGGEVTLSSDHGTRVSLSVPLPLKYFTPEMEL